MDTKIIEYIIAISEEKSISKAAERLYISQPALSQRLKALEAELKTPVFSRDGTGLVLTDAGRIYVNGGRSILQIKEEAMEKLASMKKGTADMLRFGCATSIALQCIPAFQKAYPNIKLSAKHCTTPFAKEALNTGSMDLAVLLTASVSDNILEYISLFDFEFVLAVPDNHADFSQSSIDANNFSALQNDYFILSPPASHSRKMEDSAIVSMNIKPMVLCEIMENESKRYMLNNRIGNAFLPNYTIQEKDAFKTYSLNPPILNHVVAAYPKGSRLSDPMKYMLELLLKLFNK